MHEGVVLLEPPSSIGQRAADEIAAANGVSNKVTHMTSTRIIAPATGARSSACFGNWRRKDATA
jgi:hypothetical protein